MDSIKLYAPIEKVDEDQKMVFGYASTEALDSQGEIVSKDALEKSLADYMAFANIREMHQPSAVGKTKSAKIDDKGLYIAVKVVDPLAWEKVKEGVYNGFSIGGKVDKMDDNVITSLQLKEISLVDRPANPEAVFDVWKRDDKKTEKKQDKKEEKKTEKSTEQTAKPEEDQPTKPEGEVEVKPEDQQPVTTEGAKTATPPATETPATPEVPAETTTETPKPPKKPKKKADEPVKLVKSVWGADRLVDLACNLYSYIIGEKYEGNTETAPLEEALKQIKAGAIMELGEEDDYPEIIAQAIELADKTLIDKKKKDEEISEVEKFALGLEDKAKKGQMPSDEEIKKLCELMGGDASQKNIDQIKFKYAGKIIDYMHAFQKGQIEAGDGKKDETVTEPQKPEDIQAKIDVIKNDIEKAGRMISEGNKTKLKDAVSQMQTAIEALSALIGSDEEDGDGKKKVDTSLKVEKEGEEDKLLAKVMPEIVALKEKVQKILDKPLPVKIKALYTTIEKGVEAGTDETVSELQKAEARSDSLSRELADNPNDPKLVKEAQDLQVKIMKLRRESKKSAGN